VSVSRTPRDLLAALRNGASGYVSADAEPSTIQTAVRAVADGEFYLQAKIADTLRAELDRSMPPTGRPVPALSREEQGVFSLIARGLTQAQVATRLGISPSTVDVYVARIRAKLDLGSKAVLALAALDLQSAQAPEPTELEIALSPREQEVLSLVVRGFSHPKIADRLRTDTSTVNATIARIHAEVARIGGEGHRSTKAVSPTGGRTVQEGPMDAAPPGPDPAAEDEPPWRTDPERPR
jgi:DNA-binding NarL/FixJ family response regulator